jgi:hypothetical protein
MNDTPHTPLDEEQPSPDVEGEGTQLTEATATVGSHFGFDAMRSGLVSALAEAGETPERSAARAARFAELAQQYPGQYIAYREEWDGARIVEPFLLAVAVDSIAIERALEALAPEQARDAVIHYLMPLDQAMMTPFWVLPQQR